jgi:hypothetical protein
MWKNMPVLRRLVGSGLAWLCALQLASAQEQTARQRVEAELLNAAIDFRCVQDQKVLKPTGYLLALHSGHSESIRDASTGQPGEAGQRAQFGARASVVVYVWANGKAIPLVLRQRGAGGYQYMLDCASGLAPSGHPDEFPGLVIKVATVEDKNDLLAVLVDRLERAKNDVSLGPLLFSGDRIEVALAQVIPDGGQGGLTYGALMSDYVIRNQEHLFLDWFQGSVTI